MATIAVGLITAAPAIYQSIVGVVHAVENIFGHGNGASKKQAALAMSGDLLNIFSSVAPTMGLTGAGTSEVQSTLSNLIDAIVAFNNASGVFVKAQNVK